MQNNFICYTCQQKAIQFTILLCDHLICGKCLNLNIKSLEQISLIVCRCGVKTYCNEDSMRLSLRTPEMNNITQEEVKRQLQKIKSIGNQTTQISNFALHYCDESVQGDQNQLQPNHNLRKQDKSFSDDRRCSGISKKAHKNKNNKDYTCNNTNKQNLSYLLNSQQFNDSQQQYPSSLSSNILHKQKYYSFNPLTHENNDQHYQKPCRQMSNYYNKNFLKTEPLSIGEGQEESQLLNHQFQQNDGDLEYSQRQEQDKTINNKIVKGVFSVQSIKTMSPLSSNISPEGGRSKIISQEVSSKISQAVSSRNLQINKQTPIKERNIVNNHFENQKNDKLFNKNFNHIQKYSSSQPHLLSSFHKNLNMHSSISNSKDLLTTISQQLKKQLKFLSIQHEKQLQTCQKLYNKITKSIHQSYSKAILSLQKYYLQQIVMIQNNSKQPQIQGQRQIQAHQNLMKDSLILGLPRIVKKRYNTNAGNKIKDLNQKLMQIWQSTHFQDLNYKNNKSKGNISKKSSDSCQKSKPRMHRQTVFLSKDIIVANSENNRPGTNAISLNKNKSSSNIKQRNNSQASKSKQKHKQCALYLAINPKQKNDRVVNYIDVIRCNNIQNENKNEKIQKNKSKKSNLIKKAMVKGDKMLRIY